MIAGLHRRLRNHRQAARRPLAWLALAAGSVLVIAAVIGLVGWPRPADTQPAYRIVDLATLDQGLSQIVRRLNDADEVVGASRVSGRRLGLILRAGGGESLDLGGGSDWVAALGINDAGHVVGGVNAATAIRAFRLRRGAGVDLLPLLPGDSGGQALDVNRRGEAVGYSSGPGGVQAVLWRASGAVEGLGQLASGGASRAVAINDAGHVAGTADTGSARRAFLWTETTGLQDLGTLPGDGDSEATGINARGEVIGNSVGPDGHEAFVWTSQAGMRGLGPLAAGLTSRALGINNRGDVVGSAGGLRAVLWPAGAAPVDLNVLVPAGSGFVLTEARDINNRGVILALGRVDDGHDHAPGTHQHPEETPLRVILLVPGS